MRRFNTACPSLFAPGNWNTFLAKSIPINATVMSLSILLRHTRSVADGGRDIHPIKWRSKYGGMDASMISQMNSLEDENRRLKRMFADLSMQADLLKEALGKK